MTLKLQIITSLVGIILFIYIIRLVMKRKLREEYAGFWLLTGISIVALSVGYDFLRVISRFLGGIFPSVILFFFGLVFLLLIGLYQSIKISKLADQVKELSQTIALLNLEEKNTKQDN